jgi:hypothetical protein
MLQHLLDRVFLPFSLFVAAADNRGARQIWARGAILN